MLIPSRSSTLPNLQLLVSAMIEAAFNTEITEVFAIFGKEVSRENYKLRKQLLTNLQSGFKLGLKSEEQDLSPTKTTSSNTLRRDPK